MSWFRKRKEQNQQTRLSHEARQRQELSASVEESLADPALQAEEWVDEAEEEDVAEMQGSETPVFPPRLRLQSKVLPAIQSGGVTGLEAGHAPAAQDTGQLSLIETVPLGRGSQRLSRTTKVRLQVVPKPQTAPSPAPGSTEAMSNLGLSVFSSPEYKPGAADRDEKDAPRGTGSFANGQSEAGIANARITAESVVIVMLAGDPGPVVVQYVSLQPHYGFTVHLSAPAAHDTPFTYAILGGN